MPHPAQLLSDPRRPYTPPSAPTHPAPSSPPSPTAHSPLTTALPAPFDPPEPITRNLLRQLVDPTLSLTTIADEHNTDLDSLCAWMAQPDIAQRFANFRSACAERTRAAAENCLSMVVQTAHAVIHEFHDDQHHMGFKPQDHQGHEVKRRNRETALRAGRLLFRLARYYSLDTSERASRVSERTPTQPRQRPTPNPTPALLALLDNPTVAAQLTQALAAHQSQSAPANTPTPTEPPDTPSQISNFKFEIPPDPHPAPAPTSAIPNRKSDIAPAPEPAKRAKQARPTTPRETPVTLTISARSLTPAAGAPHARAP